MGRPRTGFLAWMLPFSMLLLVHAGFALSISDDPFNYSAAYTDTESQAQYLNARYYDPELMRFTTLDSLSLLNRYAYADGNPINKNDPSGHNALGVLNSVNNFFNNDIFQYVLNGLNVSASVRDFIGIAAGGEFEPSELPFLLINDVNNLANSGMALYANYAQQNNIDVGNGFNNAMFATGMISSAFTNAGDALEYVNNRKTGSSAMSKFLWFNNIAMTASSGMLYPGNNFGSGVGQVANVTSNITTVISDLGSFQEGVLPKKLKRDDHGDSDSSDDEVDSSSKTKGNAAPSARSPTQFSGSPSKSEHTHDASAADLHTHEAESSQLTPADLPVDGAAADISEPNQLDY